MAILGALSVSPEGANHEITVTAMLDGSQENPPVVTGAHGRATFTLNRTTGQITVRVDVYNLPTGLTGAHIHVGPRGVNGPIILPFRWTPNLSNDFAITDTLTSTDLTTRTAQGIGSMEDALFSIASGATYVNIHTTANPGGEIRGQICPSSAAANTYNGVAVCTN